MTDSVVAGDQSQYDEKLPALDGLRAIAALSVVLTHVGTLSGASFRSPWGAFLARADVGVAVFFVLSGFLLSRPFLRALIDGSTPPRLWPYVKRRVLRIFPAYWFIFACLAVVYGVVATPRLALVFQVLLVHIYSTATALGPAIKSASGDLGHPLGPAWSLAVEISFYAFLPVLAFVLAPLVRSRERASRRRIILLVLLGLAAASLILRAIAFHELLPSRANVVGAWLPLNLDWFGAGMVLAVMAESERTSELPPLLSRLAHSRWTPAGSWLLALGSFLLVSKGAGLVPTQLTFSARDSLARQVLYAAVGFFLLAPLVMGPRRRGVVRRTLAQTPLRQLGIISYGVYLWQDVAIDQYLRHSHHPYFAAPFWGSLAFVVAAAVAGASLSYFVVERPALRLKQRSRVASPAPADMGSSIGRPDRD